MRQRPPKGVLEALEEATGLYLSSDDPDVEPLDGYADGPEYKVVFAFYQGDVLRAGEAEFRTAPCVTFTAKVGDGKWNGDRVPDNGWYGIVVDLLNGLEKYQWDWAIPEGITTEEVKAALLSHPQFEWDPKFQEAITTEMEEL